MEPGAAAMLVGMIALVVLGIVLGKRQAITQAAVSSMQIIKRFLVSRPATKDTHNSDE